MTWITFAIIINCGFLVEFILLCISFGPFMIFRMYRYMYVEVVLQLLSIWTIVLWITCLNGIELHNALLATRICQIIILFRVLRMVYLLAELKQFDVLFSTFLRFQFPMALMMFTLYTVFFFFAQIGIFFFGGKITTVSK